MDSKPMNIDAANHPSCSLINPGHGLHARSFVFPQTSLAADLNCCC